MTKKLTCRRLFNIYGHTGGSYAGNVYDPDGVCPALNTMGGGNREPLIIESMKRKSKDGSTCRIKLSDRKPESYLEHDGSGNNNIDKLLPEELRGKCFRVRRTTPAEWFRFQGVDDESIQKILSAGISKTGLSTLAGNSIVVDVLFHLFRKLLIEPEPDFQEGHQLSLF